MAELLFIKEKTSSCTHAYNVAKNVVIATAKKKLSIGRLVSAMRWQIILLAIPVFVVYCGFKDDDDGSDDVDESTIHTYLNSDKSSS